ncbi:hypothetical protein BaRGS_00020114, partial [Batillaria attramentaria]
APDRGCDVDRKFAGFCGKATLGMKRISRHRDRLIFQGQISCGNPCEPSKPFLCRDSPTCIRLNDVCDGKWDCEGGFDEDPAVCFGASRPHMEAIYEFLQKEHWMIPKLFNGADPEMIAHELTVATGVDELQRTLGLTDENVANLRKAFQGMIDGDERPLLAMGMPERKWPEVKFLLEKLYESGFQV